MRELLGRAVTSMASGQDDQNQRCAVYSLWGREGPERKPRGGVLGAAQKRDVLPAVRQADGSGRAFQPRSKRGR